MRTRCLGMIIVLLMAGAAFGERGVEEAKAEFEQADGELNAAWGRVKAALDADSFAEIQLEQRKWLRYRDHRAEDIAARTWPGEGDPVRNMWIDKAHTTRMRTQILHAIAKPVAGDDPWTGRWIDGHGETLLIISRGRDVQFRVSVVRGPTSHLGHLTGVAAVNKSLARFSDATTAEQSKLEQFGETRLDFLLSGRRLELSASNTQYYHGARGYFDGVYYRVASLTDEDRKAVIEGWSQK